MSLLNKTIVAELTDGAYEARILEYKEVDDRIHKPYIAVRLSVQDQILEDRWYESRFPFIFKNLKRQLGLQYETVTIVDILEAATKTDFTITLETTQEYGQSISYYG